MSKCYRAGDSCTYLIVPILFFTWHTIQDCKWIVGPGCVVLNIFFSSPVALP